MHLSTYLKYGYVHVYIGLVLHWVTYNCIAKLYVKQKINSIQNLKGNNQVIVLFKY